MTDILKSTRLSILLMIAVAPFVIQAQDTSNGAATSATPATAPARPAAPAQTPAATDKKKPKKVWTNEDVRSVKGGISVVGDADKSSIDLDTKKSSQTTVGKDLRQQRIEYYRNQIQQLQAQIETADKRISQLKNFKGENTAPSGGINPSQGYNMVPLEDQLKQLEEKKKKLQAKIEDVESDARTNGIESGELR